jgi:hypothetical protein
MMNWAILLKLLGATDVPFTGMLNPIAMDLPCHSTLKILKKELEICYEDACIEKDVFLCFNKGLFNINVILIIHRVTNCDRGYLMKNI